jgi:hypothetical protein
MLRHAVRLVRQHVVACRLAASTTRSVSGMASTPATTATQRFIARRFGNATTTTSSSTRSKWLVRGGCVVLGASLLSHQHQQRHIHDTNTTDEEQTRYQQQDSDTLWQSYESYRTARGHRPSESLVVPSLLASFALVYLGWQSRYCHNQPTNQPTNSMRQLHNINPPKQTDTVLAI